MSISKRKIHVRGASVHNLKKVNAEIPHDSLTVITGVSGSGKSSLAFDTLYAEGQRRYVESLSSYARQFLEMQAKPDVEKIEGLRPAVSIDQKTTNKNPRSTVGTVTEILDYMRVLWARVGIAYSPATNLPIVAMQPSTMAEKIIKENLGSKIRILAPVVERRKGEFKEDAKFWLKKGFEKVIIDGQEHDIGNWPELDKQKFHTIKILIDRIIVKESVKNRLAESITQALNLANGIVWIEDIGTEEVIKLSSKLACPVSGFNLPELQPRLFSFNNPIGACPTCSGLGVLRQVDPNLVVSDINLPALKAIKVWAEEPAIINTVKAYAKANKWDINVAWKDLPEIAKNELLFGSKKSWEQDGFGTRAGFMGANAWVNRKWQMASGNMKDYLDSFRSDRVCNDCHGARLRPEILTVKINGKNIHEVCELSIPDAKAFFESTSETLSHESKIIAEKLLKEICERLTFLENVGLNYLTLARNSSTLSGGESQRIRLASQIGSGLEGVLYVLDEPSIGLHPQDNEKLIGTLKRLRDLGNTVLVVEHDEETMREADWIIEMGVGAGRMGGEVRHQGTPLQLMKKKGSLVGDFLTNRQSVPTPSNRREIKNHIRLIGATGNNLKNINVDIPLGVLVGVSGVSGGGKSTLIQDTLARTLEKRLNKMSVPIAPLEGIEGLEHLEKCISIDQSPIGRTPRSNPATYTGTFDLIREWYANLPLSRQRGYSVGRFSFNVPGGRCEVCQGEGIKRIEMHFLADVTVKCEACQGLRYNSETLEVKYQDKTISDVLDMTVAEAYEFFISVPKIKARLSLLMRVGLGYVPLGQSAIELSGGEAQRVKLSTELARRSTSKTMYILDEPTTGLHAKDVAQLLVVLHSLVETGASVVVVEHNVDVLKNCDWIIDLGPVGGSNGGYIVAEGTPEQVVNNKESVTGPYIKKALGI